MEKSLLKFMMCGVLTISLTTMGYGQDKKLEKDKGLKLISINNLLNKKAKESGEIANKEIKNTNSKETKVTESKTVKEESSKSPMKKKTVTSKNAVFNSSQDYVTVAGGNTFVKRNGKFLQVKNERTVGDLKVYKSGRVTRRDGTEAYLEEGQAMTMEGYIVNANETAILKERVNEMYETCNTLTSGKRSTDELLVMLNQKTMLMDKKMNLVNQKIILMLEHMNNPRKTQQETDEYDESMALLDMAIQNTEADIRDINEIVQKEKEKEK